MCQGKVLINGKETLKLQLHWLDQEFITFSCRPSFKKVAGKLDTPEEDVRQAVALFALAITSSYLGICAKDLEVSPEPFVAAVSIILPEKEGNNHA